MQAIYEPKGPAAEYSELACNLYGYLECAKAHYAHVEASGICRKFDQWQEDDE